MAKYSPSPAPAPAPAPPAPAPSRAVVGIMDPSATAKEPLVSDWNDSVPDAFDTVDGLIERNADPADAEGTPEAAPDVLPGEEADAKAETPEGDEQAPEAKPEPEKPKAEVKAEQRAERKAKLDALDLERQRQDLETRLAHEQRRAAELEAKANLPWRERRKAMTKEERDAALEDLIVGDDDTVEAAPAKPAPVSAEVAALQATVAELQKRLDADRTVREQAQVQQALGAVADLVRAVPGIPLVRATGNKPIPYDKAGRTGYEMVMATARELWNDAGGTASGKTREACVAEAAPLVQAWLYEQHRHILEARDEGEAAAPAAPATPSRPAPAVPSLGRRSAPAAVTVDDDLPDDPFLRDQAIKRQFGF